MKHNTHYATLSLYRQYSKYPVYVICYVNSLGEFRGYLTRNRRLSPLVDRAKVFYDIESAKSFAPYDFGSKKCFIRGYSWDPKRLLNFTSSMIWS